MLVDGEHERLGRELRKPINGRPKLYAEQSRARVEFGDCVVFLPHHPSPRPPRKTDNAAV